MYCRHPVCLPAATVPSAGLRWPASDSWPARISHAGPCPASFGPGDGWCGQLQGPGTCQRPGRPRGRWTHICWVQDRTQRQQTIETINNLKHLNISFSTMTPFCQVVLLHLKNMLNTENRIADLVSKFTSDNSSVEYLCHHTLNGPCIVQFLIKGEKHWPTPQGVRPWGETSLGGWYFKKNLKFKKLFRNVFSSLHRQPPALSSNASDLECLIGLLPD